MKTEFQPNLIFNILYYHNKLKYYLLPLLIKYLKNEAQKSTFIYIPDYQSYTLIIKFAKH